MQSNNKGRNVVIEKSFGAPLITKDAITFFVFFLHLIITPS